jgi:hypothetical protein
VPAAHQAMMAPGACNVSMKLRAQINPVLDAGLAILASVVLVGWLARAVAHLHDSSSLDAAGGAWTGLAWFANEGTLYPSLHSGAAFGGTRFMPLPILLHAGFARLTGEYLVAGKLIALFLAAALVALVVVVLRANRCPAPYAIALAAGLVAGGAGFAVTLGIRFDALPVILQVGAVALVARAPHGRRSILAAALLCALAVLSKLSGVWAVLAIASWLAGGRRWTVLATFGGTFAAALVGGAAAVEAASSGRFGRNLIPLSFVGTQGTWDRSLQFARLHLVLRQGLAVYAVVVAIGILLAAVAFARRRPSLWDLSLAWAVLVVGVVLLDPGAYVNHLVDVEVLGAIVLGTALGRNEPPRFGARLAVAAVAAIVCLGTLPHLHLHDVSDVARGRFGDRAAPVTPLAAAVPRSAHVLAENAYISVARGQAPTVLDPFMLLRLLHRHPRWQDELVAELDAHAFDDVVLLYTPQSAPDWYSTLHFGTAVIQAVERNYRPAEQADGYWVYVPR